MQSCACTQWTRASSPSLPYRIFGPLVFIVLFKRAGQLVKQTNFLTVLQETGGGRCLIWEKTMIMKEVTVQNNTFTLGSHVETHVMFNLRAQSLWAIRQLGAVRQWYLQ